MTKVALYSVKQGKVVDWEMSVDANGEFLAERKDEFLKFPAGLTKAQLVKEFKKHNEANKGKVALAEDEDGLVSKIAKASQNVLDSL